MSKTEKSQKEEKTMTTTERTSAIKQTATLKGDKQMKTNRETSATRESNMKITPSKLIRWRRYCSDSGRAHFRGISADPAT